VSAKSGEVGRRGDVNRRGEVGGREVGMREKFWGRKEVEKTKKFGQGKMCFWVNPKTTSTPSSSISALVAIGSL